MAMAKLILRAEQLGYHPAGDYLKRCPGCKVGRSNSVHKSGLAIDLNLYTDEWEWLNDDHFMTIPVYGELHDYWDTLGGAPRINSDLNHFSFEHNGMH
jgi:diadenosine tetraphosphatase ApaH/serine/threonine PP2A family protein phosphatase